MEKSLNDSLRDEFDVILKQEKYQEIIKAKDLNKNIIAKAFEILLKFKEDNEGGNGIDRGRASFETYLINTLKENRSNDDNR